MIICTYIYIRIDVFPCNGLCLWTFPFFLAYEWWICFGPFGRCKSMDLRKKVSRRFVKAPDVPKMVPSLKLTNRKGNSCSNPSVSGMLVSGRVYKF